MAIDKATRELVRSRAGGRCEYCQLPQEHTTLTLQVEHIIPKQHWGDDEVSNLALACARCNLLKGSNLTGLDPDSGEVVRLFHPREQNWEEHFAWNGLNILGKTPVGRTTVWLLEMNGDDRLEIRETWAET